MNRTIKDPTVKRFHYDSHDQLRAHLNDFIAAYNFARRLKTLRDLIPYEYICKIWTTQPEKFKLDPNQQIAGYMDLKWEEVYAFEHTPHPVEFKMYYSC